MLDDDDTMNQDIVIHEDLFQIVEQSRQLILQNLFIHLVHHLFPFQV